MGGGSCPHKAIGPMESLKVQSSPNCGFGDNDHAIRELMRFIEMASRKFIFEDATRNGGAPTIIIDGFKLKGGSNSFIY